MTRAEIGEIVGVHADTVDRWLKLSSRQLKLDYALWTRKAVMDLIEQETGIRMPIRTVGEYLKRWGFTPQKPVKRAYEQKCSVGWMRII